MTEPAATPWYDLDLLRWAGRRVVVLWAGREFEAVLVVETKGRRTLQRWMTCASGEMVELPPKGRAGRDWPAQPESWRPAVPTEWGEPIGEPRPLLIAPQMAAASGRKRWGTQAEYDAQRASYAAQEAAARAADRETDGDVGWWLNPAAITYSPSGRIDHREAEGRLFRAILTDGLRPLSDVVTRPQEERSSLDGQQAEPASSDDVRPERFEPTPRDVDDHDIAIAWLAALDPVEVRRAAQAREPYRQRTLPQEVLIARANGGSWREVGGIWKRSPQWAHTEGRHALDLVTLAANGRAPLGRSTPAQRLAVVRASNRAHRQRETGGIVSHRETL